MPIKMMIKEVTIIARYSATERANELLGELYSSTQELHPISEHLWEARHKEVFAKFLCNILFCLDRIIFLLALCCGLLLLLLLTFIVAF